MVPGTDPPADRAQVPEDDFTVQLVAAIDRYYASGRTVADLARAVAVLEARRRQLHGPETGATEKWKKQIGDWRRGSLPEDTADGQRRLGLVLAELGIPAAQHAQWWARRHRTETRRRRDRNHSEKGDKSGGKKTTAQHLDGPAAAWTIDPVGRLIADLFDVGDPLALEVHRAIDAPGAPNAAGVSVLPRYVERAHDRRVREVVDRAAGGVSAMVVLVGGSSTGKTRACWEAVRRLGDPGGGWRVWHPIDPLRPEAFLEELPRVGPHTVVWLNEAQHYLLTAGDPGERIAGRLRGLLADPGRAPVLVMGTLWPQYADALTRTPDRNRPDPHAAARALLDGALLPVPEAFAGADLDAVRAAAGADPRLAYAVEHADDGEITQYLAGGPALLDRYHSAPPAARAVIEAAMDICRLGHGPALPLPLLEAAATGYLTDREWDMLGEDWLEQALAYTAAPAKGARGPVTRIRPRPGDTTAKTTLYRLADYLDQHARSARRSHHVPGELWQAVLAHALTATDRATLARAALYRGLSRIAFALYATAVDAGHPDAAAAAGVLRNAGREQEALTWLQRRADAGDPISARLAGAMLQEAGRTEEALAWYRRAADAGCPDAARQAAALLREAGRTEEALAWYERDTGAGDPLSARQAGAMLRWAGRTEEALAWYQRAAAAGHPHAAREATDMLSRAGRTEEALAWLQRRAGAGDLRAAREAADMLRRAGLIEQALTWYERASAGHPAAAQEAAGMLRWAGRTEEALAWYERAADAGDPFAARLAGVMLQEAGRTEEALTWYERAAAAGHPHAAREAADMLSRAGRTEEALTWYERAADAGYPHAAREAADMLSRAGRTEEALAWLQRRAEAGDHHAARLAGVMLQEAGRTEEALTWYGRAADAGDPQAAAEAADVLRKARGEQEALAWLQRRAEAGDPISARLAGVTLRRAGRTEEALTWYQRAADAGDPQAAVEAADLLQKAGMLKEAFTWYGIAADAGHPQAVPKAADMLREAGDVERAARLRAYGLEPDWSIAGPWSAQT